MAKNIFIFVILLSHIGNQFFHVIESDKKIFGHLQAQISFSPHRRPHQFFPLAWASQEVFSLDKTKLGPLTK